jgi:hypothetical protein
MEVNKKIVAKKSFSKEGVIHTRLFSKDVELRSWVQISYNPFLSIWLTTVLN